MMFKMNKFLSVFCLVFVLASSFGVFGQRKPVPKKKGNNQIVWDYEYYKPGAAIKISPSTESLPANFTYPDVVKLYENLQKVIKNKGKNSQNQNELARLITGEKILDDLTVNDLFLFQIAWDDRKFGVDARDKNFLYKGYFYGMNKNSVFYPQADSFGGCGMGTGGGFPTVNSKDDLITKITPENSREEFWKNAHFTIERFKPVYKRESYKGKLVKNEDYPDCSSTYIVPSPQMFYQLAFNKEQPYQLVKVEDFVLNLKTYDYEPVIKTGIVAWESDVETDSREIKHLFAVKLVPPYIREEKLEMFNAPENKNVEAIIRRLVVEIQGIWAFDAKTGKILSREIGQKTE